MKSEKKKFIFLGAATFTAVKIDPEIETELKKLNLIVGINPDGKVDWEYPWVLELPLNRPVEPLHALVWRFFMKDKRPLREGEILHHKNEDKNDARLSNLGPGTPALHATVHALGRQRFKIRKRLHSQGLYRPHAPGLVRDITGTEKEEIEKQLLSREEEEQKRIASSSSPVAPEIAPDPEVVLTAVFKRLKKAIERLDSGKRIPPPDSRPRQSDRLLGISRIRRGCTYAEAGLIYSLIDQGFDLEAVVHDVGLSRCVIDKMLKEPAVDQAIKNWHDYQRLPKPSSMSKLGIWVRGRG